MTRQIRGKISSERTVIGRKRESTFERLTSNHSPETHTGRDEKKGEGENFEVKKGTRKSLTSNKTKGNDGGGRECGKENILAQIKKKIAVWKSGKTVKIR